MALITREAGNRPDRLGHLEVLAVLLLVSSVLRDHSVMPRTPLCGCGISWLMLARMLLDRWRLAEPPGFGQVLLAVPLRSSRGPRIDQLLVDQLRVRQTLQR